MSRWWFCLEYDPVMATIDRAWDVTGRGQAVPEAGVPGATEFEQALLDGRLVAAHEGERSRTWIPAPGAFELVDLEAFQAAARAAAERSRIERRLPAE
jgi:hypothetical protein